MEHLPPLGHLSFLNSLCMSGMSAIEQTGMNFYRGFPSLEKLTIRNMENLEEWSEANNTNWFPSLKELDISDCKKLKELPLLPISLEKLYLGNVGLTAFPQWQQLNINEVSSSSSPLLQYQRHGPALQKLELRKLPGLTNLPCTQVFSTFTSLNMITLCRHDSLMSLGGLSVLTGLKALSISGCNNLSRASAMHTSEVTTTSTMVSSFTLKYLNIDNVELLQIESLSRITSVQHLRIENDYKMESLALAEEWLLQNCTSLTTLELHEAPCLSFLPSTFQSLDSLRHLGVWGAPILESLPEMPSSLKSLSIIDCPLLKKQYQKIVGRDWQQIAHIQRVIIS